MESEKHYRHELKFAVRYADYLAIKRRIGRIMTKDPHVSENGCYQIRSIYFDNQDNKALREKTDGIGKREKFRIRCIVCKQEEKSDALHPDRKLCG